MYAKNALKTLFKDFFIYSTTLELDQCVVTENSQLIYLKYMVDRVFAYCYARILVFLTHIYIIITISIVFIQDFYIYFRFVN